MEEPNGDIIFERDKKIRYRLKLPPRLYAWLGRKNKNDGGRKHGKRTPRSNSEKTKA